jgi:hypothetical protein
MKDGDDFLNTTTEVILISTAYKNSGHRGKKWGLSIIRVAGVFARLQYLHTTLSNGMMFF